MNCWASEVGSWEDQYDEEKEQEEEEEEKEEDVITYDPNPQIRDLPSFAIDLYGQASCIYVNY